MLAISLNPIDWATGAWDAVTSLVGGVYELAKFLADPIGAIIEFIGGTLAGILQWLISTVLYLAFSDTLKTDLSGTWFLDVYGKTMFVGLLLVIIAIVATVGTSIVKGRADIALRGLLIDVPIAVFGMVFAVALVSFVLKVTDEVSAFFLDAPIQEQLRTGLAPIYTNTFFLGKDSFWLTFAIGILMAFSLLTTIAILIARTALIYFAVVLIPFGYAAYIFPALRGALRRTVETVAALIFAKPAIALALTIGTMLMGQLTNTPAQQPQSSLAFEFLDRGTLVYNGTYEVERVSVMLAGDSRATYNGPVRARGFFRFVYKIQEAAVASSLNQFYTTSSGGGSGIDQRVYVRGNTIYQQDPRCTAYDDLACPIGKIGKAIDPDAEQLFRVVVPTSVNEGVLRPANDAPDFATNRFNNRRVVFDRGFLETEIFFTEEGAGRRTNQTEITDADLGLVSNEQWQRLQSFIGYQTDPVTGGTRLVEGADPIKACTTANVEASYTFAAPVETAGLCATINTSGEVIVDGRRIGTLAAPDNVPDWDMLTMIAGIAIFLMTAMTPVLILRLFPLIDSTLAIAVLADYGKGPAARIATIKFNLGRIERFGKFISGAAKAEKEARRTNERPDSGIRRDDPAARAAFRSSGRFGSTLGERAGSGRGSGGGRSGPAPSGGGSAGRGGSRR